MSTGQRAVLAAWALIAACWPVAAEPLVSRWAANPDACNGAAAAAPPITVTPMLLTWADAACRVQSSYRVGNAWHVGARCWGEGAISDIPLRLEMQGERLVLYWPKARPEELQRCPQPPD